MKCRSNQILKRKSPIWFSVEKTIFHIDFDVLILSADFQTKPPPPNAIWYYTSPEEVLDQRSNMWSSIIWNNIEGSA